MPLSKNQIISLEITDVTALGSGIGRYVDTDYPEGFVIFVPLTAPGDVIDCKIVKVEKNYAYGIIDEIKEESKDRVNSLDCPVFKQCGGCAWRHVTYDAELRYKQQHVSDCIHRIGGIDTPVSSIVPSELIDSYRNKAQYPIQITDNGVKIGFFAQHSHRIIESNTCLLQPTIFSKITSVILDWINEYHIPIYDEKQHSGLLRHIYLRQGHLSKEIMVCLVCTKDSVPFSKELINKLTDFSEISSVIINVNSKKTNIILGEKDILLFGKDTIKDTLCNLDYFISPKSFYQVNSCQAERLYSIAADLAKLRGDEILIDLFCGIGTIGLSMADKVKKVIGIEIVEDAIVNARENAKNNQINNVEFFVGDAGFAANDLYEKGIKPDIIVVDPPRKGCSDAVLQAIIKMNPKKIVYISCNPSTLARDLKVLQSGNYVSKTIVPVDMFPRTAHVETCCLIERFKNEE